MHNSVNNIHINNSVFINKRLGPTRKPLLKPISKPILYNTINKHISSLYKYDNLSFKITKNKINNIIDGYFTKIVNKIDTSNDQIIKAKINKYVIDERYFNFNKQS